MEVILRINGKDKTFVQNFISGRMFRTTIMMQKKFGDGSGIDETTLDSMVDYVVDLFGKQFTRDEYYDGIEAKKLISTVVECINEVVGGATEAAGVDPDDPN